MYRPKQFNQPNVVLMTELMTQNPFATMLSNSPESGLTAEQLPFMVSQEGDDSIVLRAHVAKANPVWKALQNTPDVLVVFKGVDSYISPNWYPSKKVNSKVVPTWNYSAVHAKGRAELIHDAQWILSLLNDLTDQQERDQDQPWAVSDAPQEFIDSLAKAVVGIRIVVDELTAKDKLSQNQSAENRHGVKAGLKASGNEMFSLIKV